MTKPSQTDRVYQRLQRGPLTQLEALTELGVMRLGARILELREQGIPIETEMVEVATRVPGETARVARYSIPPCNHERTSPVGDAFDSVRCLECGLITAPAPAA